MASGRENTEGQCLSYQCSSSRCSSQTRPSRLAGAEIRHYLTTRANPLDSGRGLHIEGELAASGTARNYVVLRILGMNPDHPVVRRARGTPNKLEGVSSA